MAANGDLDLARAQRSYIYGNTLRKRCSGVGNEWLIGIRRRQFTGSAIAEKVVERSTALSADSRCACPEYYGRSRHCQIFPAPTSKYPAANLPLGQFRAAVRFCLP